MYEVIYRGSKEHIEVEGVTLYRHQNAILTDWEYEKLSPRDRQQLTIVQKIDDVISEPESEGS